MTDTKTIPWGYSAAVPPGVKAAWGARLIIDGNSYRYGGDLLGDRQGGFSENHEYYELLHGRLNRVQPWKKPLAGLICDGVVKSYEENEVTVYEDDLIKVVGNSNGSYGYFYIAAWLL